MLLTTVVLAAQERVTINIDVSKPIGRFEAVWAWVGHDEPNYTYSNEGRSLLAKLSQLSSDPVYDRTHNLLTSGDGTPALKWGSTNALTRDPSGKPVYNWSIIDKIFDTYKATGITPFVEIGFMPETLSTHPEPYQHHWPKNFDTGWAYPPKNYREWSDLIYAWVRHMVERYGAADVANWQWEVWNEPDILYWHGSLEEYCKLYDYSAAAVRRALPAARVGGPATTGPASQGAADFLRGFLEHCANGQNYATGEKGAPLDFISFHAKGKATLLNGHVELSIGTNLRDVEQGFAIIEKFPMLRQLPVILSESDPESCAACDAASRPQNRYRLEPQYASYEVELVNGTLALAQRHNVRLKGTISWAFAFPGQPLFAGLRAFTSQGIDLPVLNAFRMLGQLRGERLTVNSDGSLNLDEVLQPNAGGQSEVNAIATYDGRKVHVLLWNYHDNSNQSVPAEVHLKIGGLPPGVSKILLEHWRIDQSHSNAYTAWQMMGSPRNPSLAQLEQMKAAGELQLLEPAHCVGVEGSSVEVTFTEPTQGVSLLNLNW